MGAVVQFRMMGGLIGLSIAASVMNSWIQQQLSSVLSTEQLTNLLQSTSSIHEFPSNPQVKVQEVFSQGYNQEMKVIVGFCAIQFLAGLCM